MSGEHETLRLDQFGNADPSELADAIDLASDQDRPTWIADADGKRVAVVVPVEVLEHYDAMLADVLKPAFSKAARGGVEE